MGSALKEANAWNPLYAYFMIAVMLGYIPGMAMFCEILMCRVLFTIYAYDSTETEGAGEGKERTRDNGSNEEEKISVIRNLDCWPRRMSFREDVLTV